MARRFEYKGLPEFFRTWGWKNSFLRSYEDFTTIAAAVAQDLKARNVRYVEAFYSPIDFARHGLAVRGITEAIRTGLDRVEGIEVALVTDLVRDGVVRITNWSASRSDSFEVPATAKDAAG